MILPCDCCRVIYFYCHCIQNFQPAALDDGLLEVVGISGVVHMVCKCSCHIIVRHVSNAFDHVTTHDVTIVCHVTNIISPTISVQVLPLTYSPAVDLIGQV